MSQPALQSPFPFHHGSVALSFAGTVGDRGSLRLERIGTPQLLGSWLRDAGLTPEETEPAAATYRRALALREAIARAAGALIAKQRPAKADVATINEIARRWAPRPYLDAESLTRVDQARDATEGALGRVALDAIDVLGNAEVRSRLRTCAQDSCAAFILTPPGRRERRWCSMARCGNRAKVTAFRVREAQAGPQAQP